MRRACCLLAFAAMLFACSAPRIALAAGATPALNGIGFIDYTSRPTFKVGDWVKYHMTVTDPLGIKVDDYFVTILVPGEELWWGERCFYVETWTDDAQRRRGATAMLMSYGIFGDTLSEGYRHLYQRKIVTPYSERAHRTGQQIMRPNSLKVRSLLEIPTSSRVDTIGPDTVRTPRGLLRATKFTLEQIWGNDTGTGDSTIYREQREFRTKWRSPEVPLTHLARQVVDVQGTRKAWLVGRSREGLPPVVENSGTVVTELVDFGSGLKSQILPPEKQRGLDDAPATPKRPAAAKPKSTGTKKVS